MSEPLTPLLLRAAADIIVTRGWCRGKRQGSNGEVCAEYSLSLAARQVAGDYLVVQRRALIAAYAAVASYLGPTIKLPRWNDDPGRTQDEVVATFRDIADWASGLVPLGLTDKGAAAGLAQEAEPYLAVAGARP